MNIKIQVLIDGEYETILKTDRYNYYKIIQALENDIGEYYRAIDESSSIIIYTSK